ncbi:uncharacterized protein LOC102700906 [Oryza brachyantha]|uniref:DUF4220 domain-containing protein n=1 Tax=Oryza brachyantha TaxID=4533 RepID=J3MAU4_ORYBR|nr:uncharacterized protein LOC102700906 [Oryza brachyantha]
MAITWSSYPYSINSSSNCTVILSEYVRNLTSSYADKSNEASIVTTSVVMFILAALFFILNFFSRVSDVSAVLHPTVRLFLSTSLSLFLPVMSYLFSEAKNNSGDLSAAASDPKEELSLRARTILAWMLLVELLRKKVEAILIAMAGAQGYLTTIDRAGRIAWLGYLVFFNVKSAGKKTIYGFLWVLAATKLVQRVLINEVLRRSFAYAKNAQRLHSYMDLVMQDQPPPPQGNAPTGADQLKGCKFAVMGEEDLELKASSDGYFLSENKSTVTDSAAAQPVVVTVGQVWTLAETDPLFQRDHRLKRLCLSFALHKLLRRRFEGFQFTDTEVRSCRDVVFKGLCHDGTDREAIAVALFQVLNDETHFVCEYYHSVLPVVLSSPFFLLANYFLFPIIVLALFFLTIIICNNGDLFFAFHSLKSDNLAISFGLTSLTKCLLRNISQSAPALYATVDLAITTLLVMAFVYEEFWEFVVFINSNWFMVSLLHDYTSKPHRRKSPTFMGVVGRIMWIRNSMSRPRLCFHQLSVLQGFLPCRHPTALPYKSVPKEVKKAVMEYLMNHVDVESSHGHGHAPLSNGWSILQEKHPRCHSRLSWACHSSSLTEVMLTWHVATGLLEEKYPKQTAATTTSQQSNSTVAATLSKYCAYLVAFHPELLPDVVDGTKLVYDAMKRELKSVLGCSGYCCPHEMMPSAAAERRYSKVMQVGKQPVQAGKLEREMSPVWKGARVADALLAMAGREVDEEGFVWQILADIWTELIVYSAPSDDELHVKAHGDVLAQGGAEFITVLWVLATHTGVARPSGKPWENIVVENLA